MDVRNIGSESNTKETLVFTKLTSWSSSIFLIFLFISVSVANTYGMSVSYSYHDESGSISDSQNYNLDASTTLKSTSIFEGSRMEQAILANGKGQNSLGQQITGNMYSFENTVSSSGSFGVSSSSGASSTTASTSQSVSSLGETTLGRSVTGIGSLLQNSVTSSGLLSDSGSFSASADGGSMNQLLVGKGNVALVTSGIKGKDNSGQKAIVEAGSMVSSQGISSEKGVSSSQSTAISGEAGGIGSGALTTDNMMLVTGNFVGSGSLNAKLDNSASDHAFAHGKVSVNGGTLIDDSTIQSAGKDGIGLNVEGLTATPEGSTGSFSATVVNMNQANSKLAGSNNVAAAQAQTGYNLWTVSGVPMKWTTKDPQVQLYLVGSSVPGNLKQEDVQSAISTAANTWGNVVGQNLFADGSTVKIDNTKKVVPADGSAVGANTQGWRTLSSKENPKENTLAITYNRFNGPSGGYYSIIESDTAFNSEMPWSTTGGTYDVQSVSLHELGHTIGLGHISDTNQIMNPTYTGSHSLGPGDIAGAQFLYGKVVQNVRTPVYRMWNPAKTDHFYTTSYNEYSKTAVNSGYKQQGILGYIFSNSQPGTTPIYRMWNPAVSDHVYTTSFNEYSTKSVYGYKQEGILGYIFSSSQPGTTPVYRMWNPAVSDHVYTTSYSEYSTKSIYGYKQQGILDYIFLR